jgi:hypothetical protein
VRRICDIGEAAAASTRPEQRILLDHRVVTAVARSGAQRATERANAPTRRRRKNAERVERKAHQFVNGLKGYRLGEIKTPEEAIASAKKNFDDAVSKSA